MKDTTVKYIIFRLLVKCNTLANNYIILRLYFIYYNDLHGGMGRSEITRV